MFSLIPTQPALTRFTMPQCAFKSCKNNYRKSNLSVGVSYFRFPSNPFTCAEWISIVARERRDDFYKPAKNSVICSDHFDNVDISGNTNRHRLVKNAIPKLQIQPPSEDLPLTTSNTNLSVSDTGVMIQPPSEDLQLTTHNTKLSISDSDVTYYGEGSSAEPQDRAVSSGNSKTETQEDAEPDSDNDADEIAKSPVPDADSGSSVHEYVRCDECAGQIVGFRYSCVQCADYDLCAACETSKKHPQHYMLRIPKAKTFSESKLVLDAVRRSFNCVIGDASQDIDVSVKCEPADDTEPLMEFEDPHMPLPLTADPLIQDLIKFEEDDPSQFQNLQTVQTFTVYSPNLDVNKQSQQINAPSISKTANAQIAKTQLQYEIKAHEDKKMGKYITITTPKTAPRITNIPNVHISNLNASGIASGQVNRPTVVPNLQSLRSEPRMGPMTDLENTEIKTEPTDSANEGELVDNREMETIQHNVKRRKTDKTEDGGDFQVFTHEMKTPR